MSKKRWNKGKWKKWRSLLVVGLSLMLVTGLVNLSDTMEVRAEGDGEVSTQADTPQASVVQINYSAETISFDDTYEVNTSIDFNGTGIGDGDSIKGYISGANGIDQKLYVRVKATPDGAPASGAAEITIPKRSSAPNVTVSITASRITVEQNSLWEYSTDGTTWANTCEFTELGENQAKTCLVRVKATGSSFASAIQSVRGATNMASYEVRIPPEGVTAGSNESTSISCIDTDMGYGWKLSVSVAGIEDDGYLKLTRQNDGAGTQIKTKVQVERKYIGKNDTFELNENKKSVGISALNPQDSSLSNGTIPAGSYEGNVTFRFTYSDIATQR